MPKNDVSKPKRTLPKDMTPAVAQAVLEDAMLEAAADIAALSATLGVSSPDAADDFSSALPIPETPEEEEIMDILGVPYLGPARRQLLAEAGIETLADLQAVSPDTLGGIKGVGMGNARRIKDWLASQPAPAVLPVPVLPAPVPALPAPVPAAMASSPAAFDDASERALASINQDVQDLFGRIDQATQRLKTFLSPDGGFKRLERQLEKLDSAASELAEGPDTLSAKQVQRAVKTLDKVAALLEEAAGKGVLSSKKQEALTDTLKEQRKSLEKTLGE